MNTQEINKIRNQLDNGLWPKYLKSIEVYGLRGLSGIVLDLKFPITAIVGENGTGKSTLLKAAACAYINEDKKQPSYYPSYFFLKTMWDKIGNVILKYKIIEGNKEYEINITKSKKRMKWSLPKPSKRRKRNVYFLDITRAMPLEITAGYAKIAKEAIKEIASIDLTRDYLKRVSYILGRLYSRARFVKTSHAPKKDVGLLTSSIKLPEFEITDDNQFRLFNSSRIQTSRVEISGFHQGAGESSTLGLIRMLQEIPDNSLVVIDEIEASLHPKAQRRLVDSLLWLCRIKRLQIILSTHSPYILEELPEEARVLLLFGEEGNNLIRGVTPELALSAIDDKLHPELFLFVEDRESKILLREVIVNSENPEIITRVEISAVGPANVIRILGGLVKNGKLPYKAIAFEDGDQEGESDCVKLPGNNAPEIVVFDGLQKSGWVNLDQRFGIGAGTLYNYLDDAILQRDYHDWLTYVGDHVKKSRLIVWDILANQWCKKCLNEKETDRIVDPIRKALNIAT